MCAVQCLCAALIGGNLAQPIDRGAAVGLIPVAMVFLFLFVQGILAYREKKIGTFISFVVAPLIIGILTFAWVHLFESSAGV